MNILVYNGIHLDLLKLHTWHREAIYNGNQYLYTRHILSVTAALNPNLSSYSRSGTTPKPEITKKGAAPQRVDLKKFNHDLKNQSIATPPPLGAIVGPPRLDRGNVPASITDDSIRHALLQPRCQLLFDIHNYPILYSPWAGYVTDATGGPLPLRCDVIEMKSSKTFIIQYTIQTDINECHLFKEDDSVSLISHTWTMSHEVDADCLCVRTIEGRLVFSRDVIEDADDVPDAYRPEYFHALLTNFKREKLLAKLQPDGCTLDYVIVDRERQLNININGCTRLEGFHTVKTTWQGAAGMWKVGKEETLNILRKVGGIFRTAGESDIAGPLAAIGETPIAIAELTISLLGSVAESFIPQIMHSFVFRLWGNRDTTRENLTLAALGLLYTRLNSDIQIPPLVGILAGPVGPLFGTPWSPLLAGFEMEITHDLANKMVELKCITLGSPYSILLSGPAAIKLFSGNDDTTIPPKLKSVTALNGRGIQKDPWDGIQGFPSNDTTRGTYGISHGRPGYLDTQILLTPCQIPPAQRPNPGVPSKTLIHPVPPSPPVNPEGTNTLDTTPILPFLPKYEPPVGDDIPTPPIPGAQFA